jgi:hypothetical protein
MNIYIVMSNAGIEQISMRKYPSSILLLQTLVVFRNGNWNLVAIWVIWSLFRIPTREIGSHGCEDLFRLEVVRHASQVFQLASYVTWCVYSWKTSCDVMAQSRLGPWVANVNGLCIAHWFSHQICTKYRIYTKFTPGTANFHKVSTKGSFSH